MSVFVLAHVECATDDDSSATTPFRYVPVRSSSRVRVLAELKQREQEKLENEKYTVAPLRRTVPFESQFRWSDGQIQPAPVKRRVSTPDPNADAENNTKTRSSRQPKQPKINEREERARKRGYVEIKEEAIKSESESEVNYGPLALPPCVVLLRPCLW